MPSMVRVRGSKVKYARWSSHDLKVLDGKDKLVVESNPTIFKSHLICNTKFCTICVLHSSCPYVDNANLDVPIQVTFENCGIWLHHQFIFPIEYFQAMAGPPWPLTPVCAPLTGLGKPNKWFFFDLLLDCANLINTRPNTKEYCEKLCLALSTLSCPKIREYPRYSWLNNR